MSAAFGSREVADALAALASRGEPAAGGVASALAGASAAALLELTAGLASDHMAADGDAEGSSRQSSIAARAADLRGRLLEIADEDVSAYGEVAGSEPGAARTDALARASEPPLAIAEAAAEMAEAAAETAGAGDWAFRADAIAAAVLAAAAASAGAEMVATDLSADASDPRIARARGAAEDARRAAEAAAGEASG